MKPSFISLLVALLYGTASHCQVAIIPKPNSIKMNQGVFNYSKGFDIKIVRGDDPTKLIFQQLTEFVKSKNIPIVPFSTTTVTLNLLQAANSDIPADGYSLVITPNNIAISSTGNAGLFHGVQSFFQVLGPDSTKSLPCLQVTDKPAFGYRGFHLDVSRHFFGVDVVKQYIDVMAKLKMNQFHWHLTDDQGWRIEIKKYPKLTQTGSCRKEKGGVEYCGAYTQEQIRQVVQYAKERYINIIPEIEMPGHASAMIAAYPELGCYRQAIQVPNTFGIKDDILCPSDSTFTFLKNVLDEVCAMFPGKYIHLGGDEIPAKHWEESDAAKEYGRSKNIPVKEFSSHFLSELEKHVAAKGKKVIGWGEIMDGEISKDVTVMSWRGTSAGLKAAAQGNDVIMTPRQYAYFDYQQDWEDEKKAIYMTYLPLDKVYSFDPASGVKTDSIRKHILGGQACVWTEYIENADQLQYQVFPRIAAMAECLWSEKSDKKFRDFEKRLAAQRNYFVKEKDMPRINLVKFKPQK